MCSLLPLTIAWSVRVINMGLRPRCRSAEQWRMNRLQKTRRRRNLLISHLWRFRVLQDRHAALRVLAAFARFLGPGSLLFRSISMSGSGRISWLDAYCPGTSFPSWLRMVPWSISYSIRNLIRVKIPGTRVGCSLAPSISGFPWMYHVEGLSSDLLCPAGKKF